VAVVIPVVLSIMIAMTLAAPVPAIVELAQERVGNLEHRLALKEWSVVIVGNSSAKMALDKDGLREPDKLIHTTLPGSTPATWYAVLKHLVYRRGLRPDRVIVAAPMHAFLMVEPQHGLDAQFFLEIVGTDDPAMLRRLGRRGAEELLANMEIRRRLWRSDTLQWVSEATLFKVPAAQRKIVLDGVFGRSAPRTNPMFELGVQNPEIEALETDFDRTFMPDIIDLVQSNGGQVVFAAVPIRDGDPAGLASRKDALKAWMEERDAMYFTMSPEELHDRDYGDEWHLSRKGAARYTASLAEAMEQQWPPAPRARRRPRRNKQIVDPEHLQELKSLGYLDDSHDRGMSPM